VVTICTAQRSLYIPHSGHYMYRQWSLYVPHSGHYMYRTVVTICTASLTFNNSTFCPHSVFMCFVWISEQTAIISLCNVNWLVFRLVNKIAKGSYCLHVCPSVRRLRQDGFWWNLLFGDLSKVRPQHSSSIKITPEYRYRYRYFTCRPVYIYDNTLWILLRTRHVSDKLHTAPDTHTAWTTTLKIF
jgi:hypothetical protein